MGDPGSNAPRAIVAAEGALKDFEDRYRALVETTNSGFVILGADGAVLDANAQYVALTGHRHLDEIVGRSVTEWTCEADRDRNAEEVRKCLAGKPIRDLEVVYIDGAGKLTPVEINATAVSTQRGVQILTLCRDISARRAAEDKLRTERDLLNALMGGLVEAGIGVDVVQEDYRIRFQSQSLVERFGDARGRLCYQVYLGRHEPCDDCPMKRAIAQGAVQKSTVATPEGGRYELTSVALPAADTVGLRKAIEIVRDVTERERLESELRQSQKMEALGLLAGGVAHDFNNLLVGMFGYLDIALAELPADLSTSKHLREVRRAADRAAELTRQLLAFSRRQLLEPQDVDLDSIVADAVDLLRRIIGESVTLAYAPGSGHAEVRADPGQIEQSLVNLCINARDAMPDGGTIGIETATIDLDADFCDRNGWARPGHYAVVRVADDGHGMSAGVQKQIFDPFFTTKEPGKGTGLGLSTVYGTVVQHGGLINCESDVGVGTAFSLYFPITSEASAREPVAAQTPVVGGSETLLLVEDDPVVRQLAQRVLGNAGYRVLVASSGPEALTIHEANVEAISLCILDVVLPGQSGPQVWKQIRSRRSDLRALFSSGYAADSTWEYMLNDGRVGALPKPYTHVALLAKVRELLDAP
jgi:two-component system, cell cycle sensor histidine kinase and response regulator CckA